MKFHDLEQNSPEWLEFRRSHIGASDAPTIFKGNTGKILSDKVSGKRSFTSAAMQRGHDLEPIAREMFCKEYGISMEPKVVTNEMLDWASASLDGLSADCTSLLEVKCCKNEVHEGAKWGQIPKDHQIQMQWQLFVTDLELGYYCHFNGSEIAVVEVRRDNILITELLKSCGAFWKELKEALNAPHPEEETECLAAVIESQEGEVLVQEWIELAEECKRISDRKEVLKEQILNLGPDQNFVLGGVLVYKKQGRPTYDTAAMKRDGIEIEKYKKIGRSSWVITSNQKNDSIF